MVALAHHCGLTLSGDLGSMKMLPHMWAQGSADTAGALLTSGDGSVQPGLRATEEVVQVRWGSSDSQRYIPKQEHEAQCVCLHAWLTA